MLSSTWWIVYVGNFYIEYGFIEKLGGEIWEVRKLAGNSLEIFKSYGMVMEIIWQYEKS